MGPKVVDGQQIEGTFRAHQIPDIQSAKPSGTPEAAGGMVEKLSAGVSFLIKTAASCRNFCRTCANRYTGGWAQTHDANGGMLLQRPSGCRTTVTMRWKCRRRGHRGREIRTCLAASCGMWLS